MKTFFTKIAVLGLVVLVVSMLLRFMVPSFWCGPVIANKERTYFNQINDYNVVFLGTSRINHGISPKFFDKAVNTNKATKFKSRSFNFGISGGSAGEIKYVFDEILKAKPEKLRYLFIELYSIERALGDKFCVENLHTNRNKYWVNKSTYGFSLRNMWGYMGTEITTQKRWKYSFNYTVNYIENILNIGMYDSFARYYFGNDSANDGLGNQKDGYNNINKLDYSGVRRARKGFLSSKHKVHEQKREQSIKYFDGVPQMTAYNAAYLTQLNDMIAQAAQQGTHVIVLAPPLLSVAAHAELSPIFRALPPKNKINLVNANKVPQFYELENIWDGNHLNHKGAVLFSKELAKEFLDLRKTLKR